MDAELPIKKDELSQGSGVQIPVAPENEPRYVAQKTVRGLATDLANLFISGTLNERDIRRLPKKLRQEVLEKKAQIEGKPLETPALKEERNPTVNPQGAPQNIQYDGAILPPAISGVIENTIDFDNNNTPEEVSEKRAPVTALSFTENDITLARKEMEKQRQLLVEIKTPEPKIEKEEPRILEAQKEQPAEQPKEELVVPVVPVIPMEKVQVVALEDEPRAVAEPVAIIEIVETEESIEAQITNLLSIIEGLPNTKDLFDRERKVLEQKKSSLAERKKPLREKEGALEQKARQLDEETANNESEELLKERWQVEAERRTVEEERWRLDEEQVSLIEEENLLVKKEAEAGSKERTLREEIELLRKKKMRFTLEREKNELEKERETSKKQREPLELEWIRLNEKKKNFLQSLTSAENNLKQLASEKKQMEEKEAAARDSNTRHSTESARWEIEKRRKEKEISYLESRKMMESTEKDISSLTEEYRNMLRNEINIEKELERIKEDLVMLP